MQPDTIYAFDFDGVICDSAVETGMTGWKAAKKIWYDMGDDPLPSENLIDKFRTIRPLLETGYEAILIIRLLYLRLSVAEICQHYQQTLSNLVHQNNLHFDTLKQLFGETRDHWIRSNEQEWLAMNPLFPTVKNKLNSLPETAQYIITTKQERFVTLILQFNGVPIQQSRIFGMDRQMSKQETLGMLKKNHPNQDIVFIEDRVQTLVEILQNPSLHSIKLQLASWGYNTSEQRSFAIDSKIQIISQL